MKRSPSCKRIEQDIRAFGRRQRLDSRSNILEVLGHRSLGLKHLTVPTPERHLEVCGPQEVENQIKGKWSYDQADILHRPPPCIDNEDSLRRKQEAVCSRDHFEDATFNDSHLQGARHIVRPMADLRGLDQGLLQRIRGLWPPEEF